MESVRQMLGCMFVSLADAGGPEVMQRACATIDRALACGAVDDLYARNALAALVRSCEAASGTEDTTA